MHRPTLAAAILLTCSGCAHAKPKHWYRDGKGLWLPFALMSAASAFDIETSQRCFREFPGRCVETNPILGQRRPRGYAVNEAFDFALALGMHRARARTRVWWTPQIVPEAAHVALGIRNLRAHLTPMKCATSANITICSGGALQF